MLQDERDDGEKLLVVAVFVSPVNLKRGGVYQPTSMHAKCNGPFREERDAHKDAST